MLERINQKHAVLVAQRGQLEQQIQQASANLNATIGAIMACEELQREVLEDMSKAAAIKEPAPEMLPVQKFEPCVECPVPTDCERCEDCLSSYAAVESEC